MILPLLIIHLLFVSLNQVAGQKDESSTGGSKEGSSPKEGGETTPGPDGKKCVPLSSYYGSPCKGLCLKQTSNYYWCITTKSGLWDRCSPSPKTTSEGQMCRMDSSCKRHDGTGYFWCYTSDGSWGHCSPCEGTVPGGRAKNVKLLEICGINPKDGPGYKKFAKKYGYIKKLGKMKMMKDYNF